MKSSIAREKFGNEKNKKGFDPHRCNLLGMNIYFVIKKTLWLWNTNSMLSNIQAPWKN